MPSILILEWFPKNCLKRTSMKLYKSPAQCITRYEDKSTAKTALFLMVMRYNSIQHHQNVKNISNRPIIQRKLL